jgi:hypothetical protein
MKTQVVFPTAKVAGQHEWKPEPKHVHTWKRYEKTICGVTLRSWHCKPCGKTDVFDMDIHSRLAFKGLDELGYDPYEVIGAVNPNKALNENQS